MSRSAEQVSGGAQPDEPLLALREVTARFGLSSPLSLSLSGPALIGVIGPNGAGKSTLLRMILGVEAALTGSLRVAGCSPAGLSGLERVRLVSYLPQNPSFSPYWTVAELVSQGLSPRLLRPELRAQRLNETLTQLGLEALSERRLGSLSGGERRRALIGRTLAQRAHMSLLDEPLAHLDWARREELMSLMRQLVIGAGQLALIALHDLNLAALYCDQLLLLSPHHPPQLGAPQELMSAEWLKRAYGREPLLITHPERSGPLQRLPRRS